VEERYHGIIAPMGVPFPFIIPRVFLLLDAQLALLAGMPAHAFRRNLRKHLPLCLSSQVVPVSEVAIIIAMISASGLGAVINRKMIIGPEWSKILRG